MKYKALGSFFAFIFIWQLLAQWVQSNFVPSPFAVLQYTTLDELGIIFYHIGISFLRIIVSLVLALTIALPLGLTLGFYKQINAWVSPFLYFTNSFPKIVMLPIFIMWLGVGNESKIALLSLIAFYQMLFSIRDGAKDVDQRYILSYLSLGRRTAGLFWHVLLPACYPKIFTSLRISLASSFSVLFLTETYATLSGIGYYIWDAFAQLHYLRVYLAAFCLCCFAFTLNLIIDGCEKKIIRWR